MWVCESMKPGNRVASPRSMHDALALDHYDARGLQLTVLAIEQVCNRADRENAAA